MNINATLISQALIFAVFVYICYKYIWPPILSTMEERENKMAAGLEAAKQADDSLEEAKLTYEKELKEAKEEAANIVEKANNCLLYTSPSPRDKRQSRMPSSA